MTEDTPVAIASTTKGMTALAIMQLIERGLVDLGAPAIRYVPDFTMNDAWCGSKLSLPNEPEEGAFAHGPATTSRSALPLQLLAGP